MKLNARGPLENVFAKKEHIFEVSPHNTHTVQFLYDSLYNYPLTYGHTAYGGENDHQHFFGRVFHWNEWVDNYNLKSIPHGIYYLLHWAMNEGPKCIHPDARSYSVQRIVLNGQTPNQKPTMHFDDVDDPTKWSFIYYITPGDESNGGTVIYNNAQEEKLFHTCTYEQGKWLIFPSCYVHQALPSIEDWRMSANFVIRIHTPQNMNHI